MYKPEMIRTGGMRGTCKLKMSDDGKKLLIKFTEDKENATSKKLTITHDKEHSQSYAKRLADGETTYRCSISQDGKKLYSLTPMRGLYKVKIKNFVANNKQLVPSVNSMWGYQHFSVLLTIIEGKMKDVPIVVNLRYNFGEKDGEVAFTSPKSKYTPLLVDFCSASGVWEKGAIEYNDNILPELEKRCLRAAKEFELVVKDGWVSTIITIDIEDNDEDTSTEDSDEPEELPWDDDKEEAI